MFPKNHEEEIPVPKRKTDQIPYPVKEIETDQPQPFVGVKIKTSSKRTGSRQKSKHVFDIAKEDQNQ